MFFAIVVCLFVYMEYFSPLSLTHTLSLFRVCALTNWGGEQRRWFDGTAPVQFSQMTKVYRYVQRSACGSARARACACAVVRVRWCVCVCAFHATTSHAACQDDMADGAPELVVGSRHVHMEHVPVHYLLYINIFNIFNIYRLISTTHAHPPECRVNYALIFKFDIRSHVRWQQLLESAAIFTGAPHRTTRNTTRHDTTRHDTTRHDTQHDQR